MAGASEKTHAKNLENVHTANGIVASLDGKFNPNNPLIMASALTEFENNFRNLMQNLNAIIVLEDTAVGERMAAFKQVPERINKIMKAAKGQGLTPEFMANLRSTAKRLNGARVSKTTPDNPEPAGESKSNYSVSRRSYAGILESLDLFDEQIKSNPDYKPYEPEYQSAAISAWIDDLRDKHNAALNAKIATRTSLNARNSYTYNQTNGILARMNALKAYVETILDTADPRFKQLKKLRFVDYSQ